MDTSSMPKGIVSDRLAGKNDPGIMKEDKATVTSQLNGRLIRVVKVNDLKGYFNYRSSDTGHIVFTVRDADKLNENHILIIQGKPVAAYSEGSSLCGSALIESLLGVAGTIEYYFIEEPIIRSVLDKFPRIACAEGSRPGQPVVTGEKKVDGTAGTDPKKEPEATAIPATPAAAGEEKAIPDNEAAIEEPTMEEPATENPATEKPEEQANGANADRHAHTARSTIAELVKSELGALEPAPERVPEDGGRDRSVEKKAEPNSKLDNLLKRLKLIR